MKSLLGGVLDLVSKPPIQLSSGVSSPTSIFAPGDHDREAETGAMGAVGTLFAVVNRLSTAVSLVDWHLYRKQRDGRKVYGPEDDTRTEVTKHLALDILMKPNQFTTRQELMEAGEQHIDLTGEGWFVVSYLDKGKSVPGGLWGPIHPAKMTPVPSSTEFLAGYVYSGPNGEKIPLGLKDVIFIRMPDPDDAYRGMGPVRSLKYDIAGSKYTAAWNAQFFVNSAEPGGIIELDKNLTDQEFYDLQKRWNEQHRGVSRAHRVALLEHGKWVSNSFSHRDMEFSSLRTATRDSILEAFAFPKSELGIAQDVNKANAETGAETFAKGLIVPRLERWKSALNNDFLPLFGAGSDQLEFDYDSPVPDNVFEKDQSLNARVTSWVALTGAGLDPVAAAEICDLPIDESVTITKPAPPAPAPVGAETGQAPPSPEPPKPGPKAILAKVSEPSDVDLSPVARSYQRRLDALLAQWPSVRGAQIEQLAQQVEQLIDQNNIAGLPEMTVNTDAAATALREAMDAIGSDASAQVVNEARKQGIALVSTNAPAGRMSDAAAAIAGSLGNGLVLSAAGEALRLAGAGSPSAQVAAAVQNFLSGLTDAQPRQQLGYGLHQAQHAGRIATFEEGEADGYSTPDGIKASVAYYASEVNDQNTCSACSAIDGQMLGSSVVDTEDAYPVGGYYDCEGGNRCRGHVVAIWTIGDASE